MRKPKFPKKLRNKNRQIYNLRTKESIPDAFSFYMREGEGVGIPMKYKAKVLPGDIIQCLGEGHWWYPIEGGIEMKRFLKVNEVERFEYFDGIKGPFIFAMIKGQLLDNLTLITTITDLRAEHKRSKKHVAI